MKENTTEQILAGREKRFEEKCRLYRRFQAPVLSVMVNAPGKEKSLELYHRAVVLMTEQLVQQLEDSVLFQEHCDFGDGFCSLLVVKLPGRELKRRMIRLEEEHPVGRFFDLDVTEAGGTGISRVEFGVPPRLCYLCGRPAKECGALGRHPLTQVAGVVRQALMDFYEQEETK